MLYKSVEYIVLLPLIGAALNGVLGWKLPRRAVEAIACVSVGGSAIFACRALFLMHGPITFGYFGWLSFSWFSAPFELRLDALSAAMALMVAGVSFLIHLYSVGYMRGEEGYARYFALLNLFVFSMLLLVMAANLPLMFLGWEGVGFCSYALIGFWYKDPDNATAGRKAFIVTRVGDVAFGVAVIWLFYFAGTTDIASTNATAAASMPISTATAIGLLLLFGASGKSAQLPLTVWLPDAMAGPTPVSALIHAATMVTAGVYLLMRLFPVISISEPVMAATAALGAVTAFYAATAALAQTDIKKVLAYSTISQIGYMVLGVGVGTVTGALFHLFVHAFFKALLFMAAGCVIQALHEEHDIFKMGGLASRMPAVFWCTLAGALALGAAPGTGGFFSKDEILSAAFSHGSAFYISLWAVGEVTALITTLYIFRVLYLAFFGEAKQEPRAIPRVMVYVLVPLAALSLFGGLINLPAALGGSERLAGLLGSQGLSNGPRPAGPQWLLQGVTAAVFAAGVSLAYFLYALKSRLRVRLVARYAWLVSFLYNAWYLDRLYYKAFVRPYQRAAAYLWNKVDEGVIDDSLDSAGLSVTSAGNWLRASVTGRASTYIISVVIGAAAILIYFAWESI